MPEVEYSLSKAAYHVDKIKELQQGKQITPTEIQIDLEAYCNHNCEFCSYRKDDGYNTGMLELLGVTKGHEENKPIGMPSPSSRIPLEFAETLPKQMVEAGIPAIELTGGGEPTLWKSFDILYENLGLAKRDIGLVTNGSALTKHRVELIRKYGMWVRISMDSAKPETHKKIHRTQTDDFTKALKAIKALTDDKPSTLTVGISFIITPENIWEIKEASALYAGMNVDHLRFSWMYDKEGHAGINEADKIIAQGMIKDMQEKYNREGFNIFTEVDRIESYSKPNTDFKTCHYQRFVMAIGADSLVYPCCIQKYHEGYGYADIREKTLKEIVYDMNTVNFMDNLNPIACNPCWLRSRNKSIGASIEQPKHHNFI